MFKLFKDKEVKKSINERRKIIIFHKNIWGHSFVIDRPKNTVCVGDECSGYAFYYKRYELEPDVLVCKVFDDGVAIIKLQKVEYCKDPDDMLFWEGIRISVNDLSETEKQYLERQ